MYCMTYSSLIPFSAINNISISINNFNLTPVFFKQACHANPGADGEWAGSSSYVLMHFEHANRGDHQGFSVLIL